MKKFFLFFILALAFNFTVFAQEVPETQKIVITKIGATWCPNCGTAAWDNFTTLHENYQENAVLISVHPSSSSKLHAPEAIEFTDNLPRAFGQPLFYVNKDRYTTRQILINTENAVEAVANVTPLANTGIIATIKKGNLEVNAKVKFFQEGSGDYYLSLLVIEDGVIEDQSNRGSNVSHKKILRTSLYASAFGEQFSKGSVRADSQFSIAATKALDPNWNTDNLEVAAIIWKREGEEYQFVNAHSVTASFSTAVNLLEKSGVSMTISPTIISESATISLNLPEALENVNLDIYNTSGQQMMRVASGNLAAGTSTFPLEKSAFKAPGMYFLRMEKEGQVISQKFIVE